MVSSILKFLGAVIIGAQAQVIYIPPNQSFLSIVLSNNTTTDNVSSGTSVGTLSVAMSPATPIFAGYSSSGLSLTPTVTGCNGADNAHFQIASDQLKTNGSVSAGTYNVCVAASQGSISPLKQNFTITVGHLIDAAATYCAANGGGDGSSGNPWQAACIQAAINAAANGDTVFLAAGNWQLQIANSPVITGNKSVNLVGAGSGNTFDYLGHPNNGSGGPVGTVTRVYTSGTSGPGGGYITFGNYANLGVYGCANGSPVPTVSHIYFDGSLAQSVTSWGEPGDYNGTFNIQSCPNATVNEIRFLENPVITVNLPGGGTVDSPNAQFFARDSNGFQILNSVITMPIQPGEGHYAGSQAVQFQEMNGATVKNNIFYGQSANPIYIDNVNFLSNFTFFGCDGISCTAAIPGFGDPGCSNGGCWANGGTAGSFHFFVRNNLFQDTGGEIGTGGAVNDPSTNGIVNDLQWSGNWLSMASGFITACQWRLPSLPGTCVSGTSDSPGMQVQNFAVTNNSIVGTTQSVVDFRGNGCPDPASSSNVGTGPVCVDVSTTQKNMQCVTCTATQNYLQSPNNQYLTNSNTISSSQSNNFCSGSTFSGCNTTGFTTLPTASFTLNPLSGSVVPFNTTAFTAQYGAVKWLSSTSPTPPGSGDARWNYLPPISLAATHGNTVYLWVMDGNNNISSATSALIP